MLSVLLLRARPVACARGARLRCVRARARSLRACAPRAALFFPPCAVLYETYRAASWPALGGLGLGPLGLSSSALSLLLVFRTNTSYQRFDGAAPCVTRGSTGGR